MKLHKIEFKTYLDELESDYDIFYYSDIGSTIIQPQTHPYYEMYLMVSGEIAFHTGNGIFMLRAGDIIFLDKHVTHCPIVLNRSKTYERIILDIKPETLQRLSRGSVDLTECFTTYNCCAFQFLSGAQNSMRAILNNMLSIKQSPPYGHDLLSDAFITEFFVTVLQHIHAEFDKSHLYNLQFYQLIAIIEQFIDERIDSCINVDDLANLVCMSKYHFMRTYHKLTGHTVYQHIIDKRLELAESLINRGVNYISAAQQSGFCDYSCFYRAFIKKYNCSPRDYFRK